MRLRTCIAIVAVALSPTIARAQLAQSHFDTGIDGWKLGDLFINNGFTGNITWAAGAISATDVYYNNAFVAPASFLGDKSAALGKNFTFSTRTDFSSAYAALPYVVISNGALRLQFMAPAISPNQWVNMIVPFTAAAGWEVEVDGSFNHQTPATNAQLLQVLSNLEYLHIQADYHYGNDLVSLDDVVMEGSTAPEPVSLVLMATGLVLIGCRRRIIASCGER